jgi:hypothetical protein
MLAAVPRLLTPMTDIQWPQSRELGVARLAKLHIQRKSQQFNIKTSIGYPSEIATEADFVDRAICG